MLLNWHTISLVSLTPFLSKNEFRMLSCLRLVIVEATQRLDKGKQSHKTDFHKVYYSSTIYLYNIYVYYILRNISTHTAHPFLGIEYAHTHNYISVAMHKCFWLKA